jgi:DNA-directed RNA polymerase subunit RPC12/RpoP
MLIRCPSCGSTFELADDDPRAGTRASCPHCGRVVVAQGARADGPVGVADTTMPLRAVRDSDLEPVQAGTGPSPVAPVESPARRVSLAILSGPQAGEVFRLDQWRVIVGRSGGDVRADIEIDDPQVSRAHAAIESHGTKVVLQDLGSSNGTFVGEERVESMELADRDEFRVGTTRLMLIVAEND